MAINIRKILFEGTNSQEMLSAIDSMNGYELRNLSTSLIAQIIDACIPKGMDRWYIHSDRRVGNNWNSNIEFLYLHNEKPYLCLYVQSSSTDSSTCVSYEKFNRGAYYNGYCENLNKSFTYSPTDIENVIRCILKEYVYYAFLDKYARERKEMVKEISNANIVYPVLNHFYHMLGLKYVPIHESSSKRDAYHRGEKSVYKYAEEHVDELVGKSMEELQAIYKKVFEKEL